MTDRLDLLKIAQEEQNGDLFKLLDSIYKRSKIQPRGYTDAIIWEGGNAAGGVKPVAHAFTDMFALNGTLMALDVLGLPFLGVPMMAQFRHDTKLVSLDWFGKLEYTALKWSTAGDFLVNEKGRKVVVNGKSANAPLRTAAGVYCNVRPYGTITSVRFMPGLPYSQDKKKFVVERASRQHPLRDEHAGRAHGLRRAPVPQDGPRTGPGRPRRHQAYPGAGRRHQRRHHPLAAEGHEVPAQAPLLGRRLRGAQGQRRRHRRRCCRRTSRPAWRTGAARSRSTSPTPTSACCCTT